MPATDNEALYDKLKRANVLDEFMELMFAHGTHYDDLLEQLEKWGISSSLGALSRFKASHLGAWSFERARQQEKDFLTQHGGDLDELTRNALRVRIFNDAASPNTSTKDVLKMQDLRLREANTKLDVERLQNDVRQKDKALEQKDRALEQSERRVEALEAQAAATKLAAEKTKDAIKSGGMDDATRAALIAEMDRMILGTTAAAAKQQQEAA